MSTFVGRMREYADVSIDRFDGINLDSNAYFLSHNHADHTVGLASGTLRYRLQSEHRLKLYCSEVTHHLLLCFDKYKHLANSVVALPLNETCIISIPDILTGKEKYKLNVTLLPAGHCPGSVMFLFEGHEETVLYTGDFRLDHGDISRIEALKSGNGPKELKSLYIDTTFCVPAALFIPSRDESSNAVIGIAEEWISQSRHHTVVIKYKALLGYEDLFRRLSEHFNMKVHVTNEKYEQYLGLADLSKFTTPHPEDTQIHACKYPSSRTGESALPCGYTPTSATGGDPLPVRTIYVSTMAFVQSVPPEAYARRYNEKSFHVCYSFHSSYGELREVIFFLRPHHAFPNVIPMGDTMPQIQERLNSLAELARRSLQPQSPRQYRELGKLKRKRKWRRPMTQNFEHSENLDFGELESSPEKRLCSNSRQPVKTKFPLLMGGSDCEELSTEISTDHKASSQERHSSDQDSSYQPSDTEPLNASLDLFDDEENVLEEEKNVMLSFTPTKGGSYGEFAFYVSDDEEEDSMSPAPGVDRRPDVEPMKAEELCAAKSQKSENGFIVNKLKTDLKVHGQKAPWDSVAGEPKETTVQKAMNVETRPELTCGVKSVADSKAVTPETTGTAAASDVESVVDTGKEERQRNAAEDVESVKGAADETNSKESNEHKEVSDSTASHPSKVSQDSETSGNDGSKSNMATATTELPQCKTQRRTEEPKADVGSTTRTPPEEAASAGHVGASATVSHCRDENVVSAAGDSQNTNRLGAVSEVDTQDVSSSIKSHGKEGRESEKRDEALGELGKCHDGDTLEKNKTPDEPKLTESGESSEKTGAGADVPKKVNAVVLPALQKRESSVNGKSKKRDSTEQVNGDPAIQMKQRGNEVTAQVSSQHRDVSVINWTDDVIVIDDDDTAPAAASDPRWPNNMTVDITCQTTDSDSTIDPTEGFIPSGRCSTVRPAGRNSDGTVLAVSGLMLDDTTTSTSDSYTSPGERRRRRRRWRKTHCSNTRPGDSSYFRRRLAGNNPGPSGSKSRLSGGDGGATIDLTSGDDTEAPAEGGDACDVDTASGVVTFDGYYADNEDGQSDSDASTAGEWDEADSPLFKAKRDHSRDTVISDVDDVIVLDDDTSDDCANKNDDVASEHCTRTVVHNPIAVPDGTVEK